MYNIKDSKERKENKDVKDMEEEWVAMLQTAHDRILPVAMVIIQTIQMIHIQTPEFIIQPM